MNHNQSAELIIVSPPEEARDGCTRLIGDCLNQGIDFYFEDGDKLPSAVPPGIEGVRGIIVDQDDYEANREAIEPYQKDGVHLHVFKRSAKAVIPQIPSQWEHTHLFHQVIFNAALTPDSPTMRQKMASRDEEKLFRDLSDRMLETNDLRWYDATCYNWNGLLDGYEVTGDKRFLDKVSEQIATAIRDSENDLRNCDRVAAFPPLLRLYQITGDKALLDYAVAQMDRYLEITPRYKGCLVNFIEQLGHARSEILFQVCPALMWLTKVTGDSKYAEVAFDQYEKLGALMRDPETGFWYHGVNDRYHSGAFWARGTAFVFYALVQILAQADHTDPRTATMLDEFKSMAANLRELQDGSGFWFQIVQNPASEKESSGTCWIGASYERAMRLGYLDESYRPNADAAWEAVKTRIWGGTFPGHGTGTTVSPMYAYYLKKPLSPVGWTHFVYVLACERLRTQMTR